MADSVLDSPQTAPLELRDFDDPIALRKQVYGRVLDAARNLPPLTNQRHTLQLTDVDYTDPGEFDLAEQKQAILERRSLGRQLKGTWRLLDNATGLPLDQRRQTLARVPFVTDRGTFIHNGNDWSLCLHPSVQIWTEHGMVPIGKIVEERHRIRVWSYDFAAQEFVLKPITAWCRNRAQAPLGQAVFLKRARQPAAFASCASA